MAVFTDLASLPRFCRVVLTIGSFDGVHLGHLAILQRVQEAAARHHGESVLITFDPHPRHVLRPEEPLRILTPLPEKLRLISEAGINHTVVVPFSPAFAAMTAHAYVDEFLVRNFHPAAIVIGHDHRFGTDRLGDISLLRAAGEQRGFAVEELPAQMVADAAVSSTKIRRALEGGKVKDAAAMLGRPYAWSGMVVRGAQLGRTLGYPTANLEALHPDQSLPADGVYAVDVTDEAGGRYAGMLGLGLRPTVGAGLARTVEVNLFDYAGDLYGRNLTLHFVAWLRGEEKFGSLDALKQALQGDEAAARRVLSA